MPSQWFKGLNLDTDTQRPSEYLTTMLNEMCEVIYEIRMYGSVRRIGRQRLFPRNCYDLLFVNSLITGWVRGIELYIGKGAWLVLTNRMTFNVCYFINRRFLKWQIVPVSTKRDPYCLVKWIPITLASNHRINALKLLRNEKYVVIIMSI